MLSRNVLSSYSAVFRGPLVPQHAHMKAYSSRSRSEDEEANLEAAREWYKTFDKVGIPAKISTTGYSMSSGPGGQKTNKTSSKATTTWPLHSLLAHVPKALHQHVRNSRYYVASSDSISIQCDTDRSQSKNRDETHRRLVDEISAMYKKAIPGVTSLAQKKRVESLNEVKRFRVVDQKSSNQKRLMKQAIRKERKQKSANVVKMHLANDKKEAQFRGQEKHNQARK